MHKIIKIAVQEFRMFAANKAFIILTLVGPLFILAVSVLPILIAQTEQPIDEGTTVAILGGPETLPEELNDDADANSRIRFIRGGSEELLRSDVLAEKIQGFIRIEGEYPQNPRLTYYSASGTDLLIFNAIRSQISGFIITNRFREAGMDPDLVSRLSEPPSISNQKIVSMDDDDKTSDYGSIVMTAMSFVMLIYMTVVLYGQMIGRSVVKEKTSKTIEIMLSSVTTRQMMFGKILGIGLAGILQYLFWIAVVLVVFAVLGPVFAITVPVSVNISSLGFLLTFFLIAYFLYSSAYAALGAAAEDEQHLGQLGMPLILFLIIPMLMLSVILQRPSSSIVVFLSHFPLTSPLVMLLRIMLDTPPAWEILISIGIAVVAIFGVVAAAAKIFRIGILMTGKRFQFMEIIKWVRIK